MLARPPHLLNPLQSLARHQTVIHLTKVYPRLERIIQVAKNASGFHQAVLMRTDLIVIEALNLQLTLLHPSTNDPWQRKRNRLLQLSEVSKANQQLLQEDISQATPRLLHQLFSRQSLATSLLPLTSKTASLDQLDSITSQSSSRVPLLIHSRSALVQVQARIWVLQGGLKPPKLQIMVSSIQMQTSPLNTFPETISSPQLQPLVLTMVSASPKTETVSLPATSKSSIQKMASTRSPSATLRLTLAPVCLEVHLWLLKKEAGLQVPLRTRNKSRIPEITRAT